MEQRYLLVQEEQETFLGVGGNTYTIRIFAFRNVMYIDIYSEGEAIALAKRVMPNQWLLPDYVTQGSGNVRFESYKADGDDYVWWEGFNTQFRLMAYTDEEIKELEETDAQ